MVKLFQEAAAGMTLVRLSDAAYRRGLRSRRAGDRITREGIKRILSNPIYWGPFVWHGQVYQGSHEPLVTKELFDEAQIARQSRSKPRRSKNSFAFAGLATCKCGKRLVGQLVKGRYVYYACSARCGTPHIREKDLAAMFLEHLKAIQISEKVAESIVTALRDFEAKRKAEHDHAIARQQEKQRRIQATIDAAYDDKLAGRIAEEYWLRRSNQWQEELAVVRARIRDLENATFDSHIKGQTILEPCHRAPELYVKQSPDQQARLIALIDSNSVWDGVTLRAIYRKPFDILAEGLQGTTGGADGVFAQTDIVWRLLRQIRGLSPLPVNELGRLAA